MTTSRDLLKKYGSKQVRSVLFTKEKKEVTYSKKHMPIGRNFNGNIVRLDLTDGRKILLNGNPGSGKTFALRSMIDRLIYTKRCCFIPTDVKDELKSSRYPIQPNLWTNYLDGEMPKGIPLVTLRPTFFQSHPRNNKLPRDNYWYSFDFSRLELPEFETLLNVNNMGEKQQRVIPLLFDELQKRSQKPGFVFSSELIDSILIDMGLPTATFESMSFKFKLFDKIPFFTDRYERSLVDMIKRGWIPSINLLGFDNYMKKGSRTSMNFPETLLTVSSREIVNARIYNEIPPVFIFLEEIKRFVSKSRDGAFRDFLTESVELHRKNNVNYVMVVQDEEDFPPEIIKTCEYIFIPHTATPDTIKRLLLYAGVESNHIRAMNRAKRVKDKLNRVRYSWFMADRITGKTEYMTFFSPMSNHAEVDT